jgi:glycosyltransferase involved in cell wall biosynthesis
MFNGTKINTVNNKGVSVVICCYNSERRIHLPLLHLSRQQRSDKLLFELIVVDNASNDHTSQVAQQIWNDLGAPFKLLIIDEPKRGLSNARKAGLFSAQFDYVLFCDDDTMPCEDFLIKVYALFQSNPEIACIGSIGIPEFENTFEPEWFKYEKRNFAIGESLSHKPGLNIVDEVVGACATFKTSILRDLFYRGFVFHNTGRIGNLLIGGEDLELSYALTLTGKKLAISSELTFKHYLPKNRLTLSYLVKLHNSFGASFVTLVPYIDLIKKQKTISLIRDLMSKLRI